MREALESTLNQIEQKRAYCPGGNLAAPEAYRPDIWALPSRDFQFPVKLEVLDTGQPVLVVRTYLLADHPFVVAIKEQIQIEVRTAARGTSYHAVDLATDKHWKDLYETRQFCREGDILWGVSVQLHSGKLSPRNARFLLEQFGYPAPTDDPVALIQKAFWDPRKSGEIEGRKPVNIGLGNVEADVVCWAKIYAIERGWMQSKGGLSWMPSGIAVYGTASGHSFTESNGQSAFAF